MKWLNKGHEFDQVASIICGENNFYYLWGAAAAGENFFKDFSSELNIKGFIDSDIQKQNQSYMDLRVYPSSHLASSTGKVIVTSSAYSEIAAELQGLGLVENRDFFSHQIFSAVYSAYKLDKLYLDRVDLSITERCTLKCEKCNMFMPYFSEPRDSELENVKMDLQALFSCADKVNTLNLLGGEPFLHSQMYSILQYIGEHYINRINRITIFTNGMLLPSDQILKLLKRLNISIQISDYTNMVDYKSTLIKLVHLLEQNEIQYTYYNTDEWLDFGFPQNQNDIKEKDLPAFFDKCGAPFRGVYDGRLYYCHLNTSAVRAGIFPDNINDSFQLDSSSINKKELMEFNLGFNDLGYCTFCSVCRGCTDVNKLYVPAAQQLK